MYLRIMGEEELSIVFFPRIKGFSTFLRTILTRACERARDAIPTVIENGHDNPSSNPGQGYLQFT